MTVCINCNGRTCTMCGKTGVYPASLECGDAKKTNRVPVDGTAVNTEWTIENAQYARRRARQRIANKNGQHKAQEIKEQQRETVHVPAIF